MRQLTITMGRTRLTLNLFDTSIANAMWEATPFEARVNTWGEEIYFSTPVTASDEPDARDVMQLGEVAYWRPGKSLCIGFGPTPVSRGDEIRLASPANVFATTVEDARACATVTDGTLAEVAKVE